MPTISQETINEVNKLFEELKKENARLKEENEIKFNDLIKYEKEIEYLRRRNKDIRQKTWIQVYDENIKLAKENEQYKYMLKSIENFIGVMESEKR